MIPLFQWCWPSQILQVESYWVGNEWILFWGTLPNCKVKWVQRGQWWFASLAHHMATCTHSVDLVLHLTQWRLSDGCLRYVIPDSYLTAPLDWHAIQTAGGGGGVTYQMWPRKAPNTSTLFHVPHWYFWYSPVISAGAYWALFPVSGMEFLSLLLVKPHHSGIHHHFCPETFKATCLTFQNSFSQAHHTMVNLTLCHSQDQEDQHTFGDNN